MGGFVAEAADISGYAPLQRAPRNFGEEVAASRRAMLHLSNSNAERYFRDRIWNERLDEVEAATGRRLPHPSQWIHEVDGPYRSARDTGLSSGDPVYYDRRARWLDEQISTIRADAGDEAAAIRTGDEWEAELRRRAAEIDAESQGVSLGASLLGGVLGSFQDPVNLATLPFGGGSRSVLAAAGKEALINAGAELAILPYEHVWRQELGLDGLTIEDAALRVAGGAAFGGLVGGGGHMIGEGFSRLSPRRQSAALRELLPDDDDINFVADMLERQADIDEVNPFGPGIENDAMHAARLEAAQRYAAREDGFQFDLFDDAEAAAPRLEAAQSVETRIERDGLVSLDTLRSEQGDLATARPEDTFPTGQLQRGGMGEDLIEIEASRADIEADIAADLGAVERLRGCVPV